MIDRAVKDFGNLPIEAGEGPFYGPTKAKFVELGEINENAFMRRASFSRKLC